MVSDGAGMSSLAKEFTREQARLRRLIRDYLALPGGGGEFGAGMIEIVLGVADRAAVSGDRAAMERELKLMQVYRLEEGESVVEVEVPGWSFGGNPVLATNESGAEVGFDGSTFDITPGWADGLDLPLVVTRKLEAIHREANYDA